MKKLQQANQTLNQEMEQMKSADQSSMLASAIKWFLAGGGVLLLGLLLGRSVPNSAFGGEREGDDECKAMHGVLPIKAQRSLHHNTR